MEQAIDTHQGIDSTVAMATLWHHLVLVFLFKS